MIQGEANDLIRRIENLELKLLHNQKEKAKNRQEKIRLIGRDKLYVMSPEDIVVENERISPYRKSIQSVEDKFPPRRNKAFSLHECGLKNVEIAKEMGVSRYIVGREVNRAEQELRDQFTEDGLHGELRE